MLHFSIASISEILPYTIFNFIGVRVQIKPILAKL